MGKSAIQATVDIVYNYGVWLYEIWIGPVKSKDKIKEEYEEVKENKEILKMKNEINEYRDKIKSLEMPTNIPYRHYWIKPDTYIKASVGKDIDGKELVIDFSKNNHLGIFGASGSGKSSVLRSIITNIMLNYSKDLVSFMFVDYKGLELNMFDDCKHTIAPTVENRERYEKMLKYIRKVCEARKEEIKGKGYKDYSTYNKNETNKIPTLFVVIDEVAQVIENKKMQQELHTIISLVRAYGIVFIICSQEASKETIGKLKVNLLHTIGLKTHDATDSNVIIKGADLQDLPCVGRLKYECMGKITEAQSYYTNEVMLRELLENKIK